MTIQHTIPTVRVSVAVIMLFQVSALFGREFVRLRLIESGVPTNIAGHQSAWAGFAALSILMWPYIRGNRKYLSTLFRQPGSWSTLVLSSVLLGLTMRAASWGVVLVRAAMTDSRLPAGEAVHNSGYLWQCPGTEFLLLSIATLTIATPIIEEIISRGYILGSLRRENVRFPILLSAFLFAILHQPDGITAAFLFGVVAAVQKTHAQSLWGPVISHATFNGLMVVDHYCGELGNAAIALHVVPSICLAVLGCAIGAGFSLLGIWLARRPGTGASGSPAPGRSS